jgi:predicted regulator of Ras-like GTPase activity (Roadblock/LC7/MglB family)
MSELDTALSRLRSHSGVEHLILLGRDGLVIKHVDGAGNEETVAARIPGIVAACEAFGGSARLGRFATTVLEFEQGVAIVACLSGDLLLVVLVQPGVGFAPLLRELRRERTRLIDFL